MYRSSQLILQMSDTSVMRHFIVFIVVGPPTDSLIYIYTMWAGAQKLLQGTSDCQQFCQTSNRSVCWHQGKHLLCKSPQQQKKKKFPTKLKQATEWNSDRSLHISTIYECIRIYKSHFLIIRNKNSACTFFLEYLPKFGKAHKKSSMTAHNRQISMQRPQSTWQRELSLACLLLKSSPLTNFTPVFTHREKEGMAPKRKERNCSQELGTAGPCLYFLHCWWIWSVNGATSSILKFNNHLCRSDIYSLLPLSTVTTHYGESRPVCSGWTTPSAGAGA